MEGTADIGNNMDGSQNKYAEIKSQIKIKSTLPYDSMKSLKMQSNLEWQKADQSS